VLTRLVWGKKGEIKNFGIRQKEQMWGGKWKGHEIENTFQNIISHARQWLDWRVIQITQSNWTIWWFCLFFFFSLVITDVSTSADSPVVQTEGNIDASAEMTTNLIAVVMTAVVSLCVLISLIICVILYFRKQRRNINSQSKSTT